MQVLATDPDPEVVRLPWNIPLEEWEGPWVLDVPRGLSRHVVRVVRAGDRIVAVKETTPELARREYTLLRQLVHAGLPAVKPQGVVNDRTTATGEELPTNVGFGRGDESNVLYVTSGKNLYKIQMAKEGYQLPDSN